MADLNFNVLARPGPRGFYQGFEQGREQRRVQENQLAEQQMKQQANMQAQQLTALKMQGYQEDRAAKTRAEKAALFRDSILRAPDPNTAREVIKRQYADPDLGPLLQQTIPIDAALSEISDDVEQFKQYQQREAMGAAKFIESQASERGFQDLLARVRGGQQGAAVAPAMPSSAPGAMAAPAELAAGVQPEPMTPVPGVISTSRVPGVTTAPISMPAVAGEGVRGIVPAVNTLAPPAAAPVNAMLAAQPAGRGRAPEQIRAEIDQLSMSSDPRAVRMVQTLMKEYEAALKPDPSELRTMRELGYPLTPEGYRDFRLAQMNVQDGALVPIVGPGGRPIYATRAQAAGQTPFTPAAVQVLGMGPQQAPAARGAAPAAEAKPLTRVQEIKRRDTLGKEFKTAQSALQTTQDVLDSIAFVKSEPGLSRATGFIGTLLPSIPEGQAASAETRLKNLEGKITALGKAQAASTGAIGSIANQEWKILADQIAAIDRTKGTGPLLAQLELVEAQAQGAMERIRDGYQRQFGEDFERFPQYSDLPPPKSSFKPRTSAGGKPAAAGGLSPAEQAELDQLRKQFKK